MIEFLTVSSELSEDDQLQLIDLLTASAQWPTLARLCHLENLSPDADARLRAVDAFEVRAAWVSRPGRTSVDVDDALSKERRVSVLTKLAHCRLGRPEAYEAIARAGANPRVALAVLTSPHAASAARRTAACRLAESLDAGRRARHEDVLAALTDHPDAGEAFACAARTRSSLCFAASVPTLAPAIATTVCARTASVIAETVAAVRATDASEFGWSQYRELDQLLTEVSATLTALAGASWLTEPLRAEVAAALRRATAEVDRWGQGSEHAWYVNELRGTVHNWPAALAGSGGGIDTGRLLRSARAAASDADASAVVAALGTGHAYKHRRPRAAVIRGLALNRNLTLEARLGALATGWWLGPRSAPDRRDTALLDTEAWVALALWAPTAVELSEVSAHGLLEDFTELLCRNLDRSLRPLDTIGLLATSRCLSLGHLVDMALPQLLVVLRHQGLDPALRQAFADHLRAQLSGEDPLVWQMLDQMSPGYPGDLKSLLAVCRASVA